VTKFRDIRGVDLVLAFDVDPLGVGAEIIFLGYFSPALTFTDGQALNVEVARQPTFVFRRRNQDDGDSIEGADGSALADHEVNHFNVVDGTEARARMKPLYTTTVRSFLFDQAFKKATDSIEAGDVFGALQRSVFFQTQV
jgi:hypothetical protein